MTYLTAFEADREVAKDYLLKSVHQKTQQQLRLEGILDRLNLQPEHIADIACGAGGLSYHLSKLYEARFTLVDLGDEALSAARLLASSFNAQVIQASAYDLPLPDDKYDLVFFWQTLLCIDHPQQALQELIRICKPGGRIFISSLFNLDSDVDLHTQAVDHTRAAIAYCPYNTYCAKTLSQWTDQPLLFHDFDIGIDLPQASRGLGTYTIRRDNSERLQVSGGMLMNWKILEIQKH